jgi:hypothetical protein
MNFDLSKVDYAGIAAAAHRQRNLAFNEFLFRPVAGFVLRLVRPEPRRPSAVFHSIRGC